MSRPAILAAANIQLQSPQYSTLDCFALSVIDRVFARSAKVVETSPLAPGRITVVVIQGEAVSRQASGHTQDRCAPGLSLAALLGFNKNRISSFLIFMAMIGLCFTAALSAPPSSAQQR